jgi:malonate-semialdehyde dehydrogenase (acetylating)/methylmalonate-semialdehyde dehydrogenase
MGTINHWINGRAVDREPERAGAVDDPPSGRQTARVAYATADDVDAAVQAAKTAFPAWRDTSVVRRARVMFAFRDILERHKDELARIITSEYGKVVPDAVGEVQRGPEGVAFYPHGKVVTNRWPVPRDSAVALGFPTSR